MAAFIASNAMFLFAVACSSISAFSYDYDVISSECTSWRHEFSLVCPTSTSEAKAGTAVFYHQPSSCTMNFTTDGICGSKGVYHAIYFNIRDSSIPTGASLDIYENVGSSQYLVKHIPGGNTAQYYNPTSAGQLVSSYQRKPSFTLKYSSGTSTSYAGSIMFDYNIVFRTSNVDYGYCLALGGYVSNDLICDGYDRVHCPSSYYNTTIMSPAISIQTCAQTTTRRTTTPTIGSFSFGNDYYGNGLEGAAIAGIVLGTLLGLGLIGAIIGILCNRSRRTHVHHQTFTANQHSAAHQPTVIIGGGYYPQPAGAMPGMYQPPGYPAQGYAGPPPAYPGQQTYAGGPAPYPAGSGPQR